MGKFIEYLCSGVCPSYVRRRRPQFQTSFFSETTSPIEAKFYVEPPRVNLKNVCTRHLGHMTKMAATPIYKTLFLQNRRADFNETWYVASGLQPIIVCSNDDPGVTLTYFTARLNLVTKAFLWEK